MKGYAVQFKTDCPHIHDSNFNQKTIGELNNLVLALKASTKCNQQGCDELHENWVCISCLKYYCSRYIQAHAADHQQLTQHPIALSMYDLSFWCYECNHYIKSNQLAILRELLYKVKFGK